MITKAALNEGLLFNIGYWLRNVQFPLPVKGTWIERLSKSELRNAVYELEQLWQKGQVTNASRKGVLVSYTAFEGMDHEACGNLGIIDTGLQLRLREESFFGSNNYSILWSPEYKNVPLSHCKRFGYILASGDQIFKLTDEQFALIEHIEKKPSGDAFQQVEYQAISRQLAEDACVFLSEKLQSNVCIRAESIGFQVSASDDQHITVTPTIDDLPENITEKLHGHLRTTQQISDNGKYTRIVCPPEVVTRFDQTHQEFSGAEVPAFLDNPLRFLTEDIHFDADLFSARVKGLKILRSSAVPYVKIDANNSSQDWFTIETGVKLVNDEGEETFIGNNWDHILDLEDESDYVYIDGQWIYRDPQIINEYRQAIEQTRSYIQDGRISREHIRHVLEIYDNIDRLEYNEDLLEHKAELLNLKSQQYIKPKLLNADLYNYQKDGYIWLLAMQKMKMGALLADDMGLGKTLQTIAFIAHLLEENSDAHILLVMPAGLIDNWKSELRTFLPSLQASSIYVHQGAGRLKNTDAIRMYTIVITTYETLARDQVSLGKIHWDFMACDETQKIKNFKTQTANAVKGMHARQRLALTGTPVENRLSELWSIVDYIQPGLLNTYSWFRKNFEEPIAKEGVANSPHSDELVKCIRPVFLRRTKEEELNLPEKKEHVVICEMPQYQTDAYKKTIQQFKDGVLHALPALTRLIEITSHPLLVQKEEEFSSVKQLIEGSGKLMKTLQILADIREKREKVLIFTRYREMQQILRLAVYHQFQLRPSIINGAISENRMDIIRDFSEQDGFNVLILSPKAAGVGLNIVAANHVIHYTREWNPAVENQATDRVYRIGQKNPVHVYYPTCAMENATTVDEKLARLLQDKRELMRKVIIPANLEIQESDLMDTLTLTI